MKRMALAALAVLTLILAACTPATTADGQPTDTNDRREQLVTLKGDTFHRVIRWQDPDYEVVCWETWWGDGGGISCLPADELTRRGR